MTDRQFIDTRDQAKIIRAVLKEAFPGTKFSVRMDRFAGGSSIDVSWPDGPNEEQVQAFAYPFRGGGFDGMRDLAYPITRYWKGQEVSFGAHYITTRRRLSRAFVESRLPRIVRQTGVDPEAVWLQGSDEFGWSIGSRDSNDAWHTGRKLEAYSLEAPRSSETMRYLGTYSETPPYV